jgi:transposase
MSDATLRRCSERRTIDLEQLKSDPASLLWLGLDDPVLCKLETYRLYQAGYAAEDIAQTFGYTRPYLYELWAALKSGGVEALVDKRWGSVPRTRTPEREAHVLRAKALNPQRSDADLAAEFQMDRSTVYDLLKEHELQDLHRVLTATPPTSAPTPTAPAPTEAEAEKGGARSSRVIRPCS